MPAPTSNSATAADAAAALERVRQRARWLDSQFTIPGTGITFGMDAVLGLVPVVGDTVTVALGFLPILTAARHRLGSWVIARMLLNLGLDWLVGLVPLLDIIFDVAFRANLRNARLLERALEREAARDDSA